MLSDRLPLACAEGLVAAPVLLIGAPWGTDLSPLGQPPTIVQRRQPDYDRLAAAGQSVMTEVPDEGQAATAIVSLPRERALARDRIARATAAAPRVLVDGQKTDGIDSLLKECRKLCEVGAVISKAHGKIFAIEGGDFSSWRLAPSRIAEGFLTAPGTFSSNGVDPGSRLLGEALPPLKGHVVDLGAGWGYLSHRALASEAVTTIDLVEADLVALDCARANVDDPRARFHWADATAWRADPAADHVICNPPFHRGRKGDPDLGRAFIAAAAACLAPRGTFWMVANRHLPYEAALSERFAEIEELPGAPAFKLYRAARPRRTR